MSRWLITTCVATLAVGGCAAPAESATQPKGTLASPETSTQASAQPKPAAAPPSSPSAVLALVNGRPITVEQIQGPLIEAYGLQFLLHLIQLDLARQKAKEANVTVTAEDIAAERLRTVDGMFRETIEIDKLTGTDQEKDEFRRKEYDRLLVQFLETQRISKPEFDLAMQTSAHLRKIAEIGAMASITDENLLEAFRIKYGERVRVRHIQVANMQELAEVRRRLDAGEPFEAVARALSRDARSRNAGGELRPFSRAERFWPGAFKDAAFNLQKPGDISDAVQSSDGFHLIKLEEKIPPNPAVKFEDHKDILREELYNLVVAARTKRLREALVAEAQTAMKIQDPLLRQQYEERLARARGQGTRDANQVRKELELDRTPPAQAGNAGSGRNEVARPPATRPGR